MKVVSMVKVLSGGKFFVGIQFGHEGLEICVQSFTAFFEFSYSEGSGLDCMVKCTLVCGIRVLSAAICCSMDH